VDLTGKSVIVTGSSSGIGDSVARQLSARAAGVAGPVALTFRGV
jgi:NAD(P)-dependent dehydrogenase (short-subunit alcohol dehydrogenase family)